MTQATPEIRRELQRAINAPPGTVMIVRKPTNRGDEIVVYLAPGLRLPKERLPPIFKGVTVKYETRRQAKAFA